MKKQNMLSKIKTHMKITDKIIIISVFMILFSLRIIMLTATRNINEPLSESIIYLIVGLLMLIIYVRDKISILN